MYIKLYAYLENNFGDDLMVDILLKRYPEHRFFYDDWWNESDKFLVYPNFVNKKFYERKYGFINKLCNILTKNKHKDFFLRRVLQRVRKKCVCAVYIGGSIYIEGENTDISKRIETEKNRASMSPLFVIGANFGPYRTQLYLDSYKEYFKKCKGVCFRDMASYDIFKDNEVVSYAPDVVFNLKISIEQNMLEKNNTIVLSIIDLENRPNWKHIKEKYEKLICDLCRSAVKRNLTPIVVAFCDKEGDMEAANRCYRQLEKEIREKVSIIKYDNNIQQIIELFEKADSVIATRFHAMILALLMNKPFYCIAYDKKASHVLDDIGCDRWISLDNLNIDAEELLDNMKNADLSQEYVSLAGKQFQDLDDFLNNQ